MARFEAFMAVSVKSVVFWDKRTQFVPERKHITSPLKNPADQCYVGFEVFMAMFVKNVLYDKKKRVHTTKETHHVSATEPSQLMLCKI
jgi:hypothetical protein